MRRKLTGLLAIVMLLAGMTGCKKTEAPAAPAAESQTFETAQTQEPMDTPEPEATAEPTPGPAGFINPLTGEATEEDISGARPYIVMTNNISLAQPQVGISQADLIYELMEEGGITRMMAFFTDISAVEKVGSIRSARIYNASVTEAYDAILVHAGGSDQVLNYIAESGLQDVDFVTGKYSGNTFYRDASRQANGIEHSLFATGSDLVWSADNMGYRQTHSDGYDNSYGLTFSQTAAEQCTDTAGYIKLTYEGTKTTEFIYEADSQSYRMRQYGDTYTDNGNDNVRFKNVLIINANTSLQSDGYLLNIELTGSGSGYFCCGGKYVPIQWSRSGSSDNFHYTLADGSPLALGVGKTFIAVQQVGEQNGVTEFFEEY